MTKRNYYQFLCMLMLLSAAMACSHEENEEYIDNTPRLNKGDSLALVEIYNAIGPWQAKWDMTDSRTWDGFKTELDEKSNELRVVSFEIHSGCNGQFPEAITRLTELRTLTFTGWFIQGELPESIGNLKHLERLYLGHNLMSGRIPESIGELANLKYLDITYCFIEGEIPESFNRLHGLEEVHITHTRIGGPVPTGFAEMDNLRDCWLIDNQFSGTFPISILKPNLTYYCQDNYIESLPFEVWNDDFQAELPMLAHNCLSGTIPQWVLDSDKFKRSANMHIGEQREGYGYTNWQFNI